MLRLRCINIVSESPEALAAFYSRVFCVNAQEIVPGRWEVPLENATLVFTHTDKKLPVQPDSCGLEFETDDVDGMYRRLLDAGMKIGEPPATYPWGWRAFALKDPDGNPMDFVQYVGAAEHI